MSVRDLMLPNGIIVRDAECDRCESKVGLARIPSQGDVNVEGTGGGLMIVSSHTRHAKGERDRAHFCAVVTHFQGNGAELEPGFACAAATPGA